VIYLFSQIAISLVLAAIVGGAAGWLVHRARAAKQIDQLREVVTNQQRQVIEAQSEVSILTADFDDLKEASESEISTLKNENKHIPELNQNLEKSQLLVRQLMEQHKAEQDEISEENEKLLAKARLTDDREKQITKLQAELDIERRKSARSDADQIPDAAPNTDKHSATSDSNNTKSDNGAIPASESIAASGIATSSAKPTPVKLPLSANAASSDLADDDNDSNDETLPNAAQTKSELTELRDQLAADTPPGNTESASSSNFVEVSPSLAGPHKLTETQVDDNGLEPLFDTVEQHDDLKQIFGIGPVTEKTLNKLGITAYSQLAELQQHDIEKIANALQIFPGRIERDNWVGGARAQLEEVLEDL